MFDICSNFLLVNEQGFVQLAHLSVYEYLQQKKTDDIDHSPFSLFPAHFQAAETCLSYVKLCHSKTLSQFGTAMHPRLVYDQLSIDFCRYAVHYWPYHCQHVPEDSRAKGWLGKHFQDLIVQRMPSSFSTWLLSWADKPPRGQHGYIGPSWLGPSWPYRQSILNREKYGETLNCILLAASYGFLEFLNQYTDTEIINSCNEDGYCALHVAAVSGQLQAVEMLLQRGLDPDIAGRQKSGDIFATPLVLAAQQAQTDIARELIKGGATRHNELALSIALSRRYQDLAEVLLADGQDPNMKQFSMATQSFLP